MAHAQGEHADALSHLQLGGSNIAHKLPKTATYIPENYRKITGLLGYHFSGPHRLDGSLSDNAMKDAPRVPFRYLIQDEAAHIQALFTERSERTPCIIKACRCMQAFMYARKMYTCASARLSTDCARRGKTTSLGVAGLVFSSFNSRRPEKFFSVAALALLVRARLTSSTEPFFTIQPTACIARFFGIFFLPIVIHDDAYLRQSGFAHVKRCRVLSFYASHIGLIKC